MNGTVGTVLELFAGVGGAALGLKRAGWEHLACIDRMPAAVATLRAAGLPALEADVYDVDWSPWTDDVDLFLVERASGRKLGSLTAHLCSRSVVGE